MFGNITPINTSVGRPYSSALIKLDILLNGDRVDALAHMAHRSVASLKGKQFTESLKEVIPRQQFDVAAYESYCRHILVRPSPPA